jgi:hypothetical protein
MRAANITAAVAIVLWLGLAVLGRESIRDVLVDDVADWPTLTNIDFSIVLPMSIATVLLAWAWFCNAVGRSYLALGLASLACLAAILPYDDHRWRRLTSAFHRKQT